MNLLSFQFTVITTADIIAGICSFLSCVLSFWMMYQHLQNYTQPRVQIYIVRIVMMVPIYSVDSFFSLLLKDYAMYWDLARDCYEAYVLFMFFRLLIELADGEENLIAKLEDMPQIRYSAPLCCYHIKPGRIFLHRCKQMILQYVLWKPILAVATFILQLTNQYDEGDFSASKGYLYITIIYNISITLALYFLVLFYEATKDILRPFKPLAKFFCIKAVIFFSFWQGVAIAGLVKFGLLVQGVDDWNTGEVARGLQDFLICVEMLPLSFVHMKTFSHNDFQAAVDEEYKSGSILHNFVEVANVTDVFRDTIASCKKGPKRNVIVGDFLSLPKELQLQRVVKQGWLYKRGEDLAKIWKRRYCCLITEPKGIVYFKKNPFEEKKLLPLPINMPNIQMPQIDLNPLNLNLNPLNLEFPSIFPVQRLKARGFVDFTKLNDIRTKKKSFALITKMRNWKFECASEEERDEWVAAIRAIADNLREQHKETDKESTTVPLDDTNAVPLEDVRPQQVQLEDV